MPIPNFTTYFSSYTGISELIKTFSFNEIVAQVLDMTHVDIQTLLNYPMGGYAKGKQAGYYQQVLEDLIANISRYDQVYELLADETSRQVFTALIQYRIIPDAQFLRNAYETEYPQYFNKDIISCDKNEVFVDCGGFIGDTAEEYIKQFQNYKHIYVYEPSDDNIAACHSNLEKYPNITIRNCGVGEKNEHLPISHSTSSSSFIGNVSGDSLIEIISLDQDIHEKITFLKMDIEGFEIPALLGAKNHIKNDSPKLAVCTYHILSDMWEIPLLIHTINPNYNYYFRHYRPDQNWETVVYAVPKKKSVFDKSKSCPKTAVAFPWREGWYNVELTKDCGYIPFLLHKNHSMNVTMVGASMESYPYLDTYVKGLNMEFLNTGTISDKLQYLALHANEIDLLLLRGAYPTNFQLAIQYKTLNPTGKIYLGLDANSHWMDRIHWTESIFIKFMNCCDVIATSCKAMQKYLNEKWPWKIEYIPNGYYNFGIQHSVPDFSKKENTILTVSRLGTPQKCTDVLLNAFALIADSIPDWNLKLIGSINPAFEKFKENFFNSHPELTSRVQFMGVIANKETLFEEYRKAKIFALPSDFEGGAPNVIAEALTAGCVIAATKFDAWEDAIDEGNCGMAVDIYDVNGFANILLTLCQHPELEQMSQNAYDYAKRNYDMEQIVARLYEMLFGGDIPYERN